jgi:hypothetical protein
MSRYPRHLSNSIDDLSRSRHGMWTTFVNTLPLWVGRLFYLQSIPLRSYSPCGRVARPLAPPRAMRDVNHSKDEEARDSDRKSKSSPSTWGTDKLTLHKPVTVRDRRGIPTRNGGRRGPTSGITRYGGEPSSNAKFNTRPVPAGHTVTRSRSLPRHVGKNNAAKFPSPPKDAGVGLYRKMLVEDTTLSTRPTVPPPRPLSRRFGGMGNNSSTNLTSLPEDSTVGVYPHMFGKDDTTLSPKAATPRPSPRHIFAINNSATKFPSFPEGSGVGPSPQVLTRENTILPPRSTTAPLRLSPRRIGAVKNSPFMKPSPPKDSAAGPFHQTLTKEDKIVSAEPIRVPPHPDTRLPLSEPTIAPSLGEYRESESAPWAQGHTDLNMDEYEYFTDWEEVEYYIETTANQTTPEPQQEAEEVYEDTWRMSIQSDDMPIPGSFFRKHYVA